MISTQQSLKIKDTVKCFTSKRDGADLDIAGNLSDNLHCVFSPNFSGDRSRDCSSPPGSL